jgi:DNA-directed RNA polymerase subunit beta
VVDGKVTDQIDYLSAIEEGKYVIAQANASLDEDGKLIDELVSAVSGRIRAAVARARAVHGRGAGADRVGGGLADALPGARRREPRADGRQHARQAVPVLRPEKPMVGTGIERVAAVDSGTVVTARRGGVVDYVDANRIVIRVNDAKPWPVKSAWTSTT